jgi:putative PIN family toxin of toxin-antitoxin system
MIRVVLDSNVYVSALLFGGNPRAVLQWGQKGSYELMVCRAISDEVGRTLRFKFNWSEAQISAIAGAIWRTAQWVEPQITVTDCSDDDDNRVLECALESNASVIVSGDRHLLALHPYRGIAILTAKQFLERRGWESLQTDAEPRARRETWREDRLRLGTQGLPW